MKPAFEDIKSDYRLMLFPVLLFFIAAGYCFLRWPIIGYDTDLWFHMSAGRYLAEHMQIPHDAFFSYISPGREWSDYYWVFQLLVHMIYRVSGYVGIVVLRATLYLSVVYLFYLFWVRANIVDLGKLPYFVVLFLMCSLAIVPRELNVRPHLFSYLLIVVFIYILDVKKDKIWLLPLIGVLWNNIHGMEYPVFLLIVMSYFIDILVDKWRTRKLYGELSRLSKWALISCLYTILITPHGLSFLQVPFSAAGSFWSLYIGEARPLTIEEMFSFNLLPLPGIVSCAQKLFVLLAVASAVFLTAKKKIRPGHLLLFLGGMFLLPLEGRFVYEAVLLSMPLVRSAVQILLPELEGFRMSWRYPAFLALVSVVPLLVLNSYFANRPTYPFSTAGLPVGVVTFLNRINVQGNILNEPNTGGYLEWGLNRSYKIFMDLQGALFSDEDYFLANSSFCDGKVLDNFIQKYDPSFISVSLERKGFKQLIEQHREYCLVFFDGVNVLYVNKNRYPDVVDAYELKHVDPFVLKDLDYSSLDHDSSEGMLSDLAKVASIDDHNDLATFALTKIYIGGKQFEAAMQYADRMVEYHPEDFIGYALRAHVLLETGKYEQAIRYNKIAIEKGGRVELGIVYRNLAVCYGKIGEYKKAYATMREYVNPFSNDANYTDIYELGLCAMAAGKKKDGAMFLRFARLKLPQGEEIVSGKIQRLLSGSGSE